MKESSGGSEDDEFPDKNESSIAASPTNGNRLNDEENANLSVEGTTINCAPVDKGLHSDENDGGDDCDVVVLKEETKKKKIGGGKKRLSQVINNTMVQCEESWMKWMASLY